MADELFYFVKPFCAIGIPCEMEIRCAKKYRRDNNSYSARSKHCHGVRVHLRYSVSDAAGQRAAWRALSSVDYNALQAGDYNGETTLQDLRAHGDFGLGTFDALNGEMVLLNGTFYQIKSDGTVSVANDSMKTPFADVTFFEPDSQLVLASRSPLNYSELQQWLDGQLPTKNIFYAVKITAQCSYVEVRSPPEQLMPYPPLVDALKNQSIFGLHNVTETFVGFFAPQYASGICVAGWHFHFLTTDDEHGGHVLDVTLQNATIQIDDLTALSVALPRHLILLRAESVE